MVSPCCSNLKLETLKIVGGTQLATVPHLPQLVEDDSLKLLLVHLCHDGSQVSCHDCRVEARVELFHVVVVEGERLIVDYHLVDKSDCALIDWNIGKQFEMTVTNW